MSEGSRKTCTVAYALRDRQYVWTVELAAEADIAAALARAREQAGELAVPWDEAVVGIFGETCSRSDVPRDGDRIEIYRPLANDPRERRRAAVSRARRSGR